MRSLVPPRAAGRVVRSARLGQRRWAVPRPPARRLLARVLLVAGTIGLTVGGAGVAHAATASPGAGQGAARPGVPSSGICSVPGIGDIGGLFGLCSAGSSGLVGDLNNICQPSVPTPEPAADGIDGLVQPPGVPTRNPVTLYDAYGMSGQSWAAYNLQCSDMASLIGNNIAGVVFDAAKAADRVTITVYQAAAGPGILGWLTGAVNRLITSLGNAIYFPYLAPVVILGAVWLAWQGLIRRRATRTIEGTVWMVLACAAALWLIGRPADFTGVGRTVSDGITQTLNVAFAKLPAPHASDCVPVGRTDPQVPAVANYSYTAGNSVVDTNANELWTVLVCKPWLDGEFGTTSYTTTPHSQPTVVNAYGRQLLWAQSVAVNENPTASLVTAKQDTYAGIATAIQQKYPAAYAQFQGKQWTSRLEIAFAALFAALVAGVLVLLIAITLIVLKLGFLLLLATGPFFLIVGTHPGFGRVVALRWAELLIGVLLKQAAVALVLSVLLYCYSLIMGASDTVLPWALKILMIALVTVAVFIYRKPFAHLFTGVGYGVIGARDRAETQLARARGTAARNTLDAATVAIPGVAAYRAARWARRNPAAAAGLAAQVSTANSVAAGGAAAGTAAGNGAGGGPADESVTAGGGGHHDGHPVAVVPAARGRTRESAGSVPARAAPPLELPAREPSGTARMASGWSRSGWASDAPARTSPPGPTRPAASGRPTEPGPPGVPGPAPPPPFRRSGAGWPGSTSGGASPPPAAPGAAPDTPSGSGPFWLRPRRPKK